MSRNVMEDGFDGDEFLTQFGLQLFEPVVEYDEDDEEFAIKFMSDRGVLDVAQADQFERCMRAYGISYVKHNERSFSVNREQFEQHFSLPTYED